MSFDGNTSGVGLRLELAAMIVLGLLIFGCASQEKTEQTVPQPTSSATVLTESSKSNTTIEQNNLTNITKIEEPPIQIIVDNNSQKNETNMTAEDYYNISFEMHERLFKTMDYYNSTLGALEYVNKAIELDPNYTSAYVLRSYIHTHLGNYTTAFEEINRLVELYPNDSFVVAERCIVHYSITSALRDCDRAIELNPNISFFYRYRAYAKASNHDHQNGIADLNLAIKLAPKLDPEELYNFKALCYVKTSRRYDIWLSKEYLTAAPDCEKYLSVYQYSPSTLITLAFNKQMTHDLSGSINDLNISIGLYQEFDKQTGADNSWNIAIAHWGIGRALIGQGKYSDSIDYFNKAIELQNRTKYDPIYLRTEPEKFWQNVDSLYAAYYFSRGVAEFRLNQTDAAKNDLNHANFLDKSLDDYELAKGILNSGYAPRYEIPFYID